MAVNQISLHSKNQFNIKHNKKMVHKNWYLVIIWRFPGRCYSVINLQVHVSSSWSRRLWCYICRLAVIDEYRFVDSWRGVCFTASPSCSTRTTGCSHWCPLWRDHRLKDIGNTCRSLLVKNQLFRRVSTNMAVIHKHLKERYCAAELTRVGQRALLLFYL